MKNAIDIVKLFFSWAKEEGELISHLKLQKLLYYAQAWHLVYFEEPLFEEQIQAWEYGPVVNEIWSQFKDSGSNPLNEFVEKTFLGEFDEVEFASRQREFLREVYDKYVPFSAHTLSKMTHRETPWISAIEKGKNTVIEVDAMRSFYKEMVELRKTEQ